MVDEIIDIEGASGSSYRFKRETDASALSGSGNFIIISDKHKPTVVCSGTTADLSMALRFWREMPDHEISTSFYTRRNVTKAMRQAEHDDICLKHAPEMVLFEFDRPS